jgi:hypothetical protein
MMNAQRGRKSDDIYGEKAKRNGCEESALYVFQCGQPVNDSLVNDDVIKPMLFSTQKTILSSTTYMSSCGELVIGSGSSSVNSLMLA